MDWGRLQAHEREAARASTRILLVEDERRVAESVRELLELYGFCVEAAADGAEAARRLKRDQYDIVLLDLNLPGMSGHDLLDFIVAGRFDTAVIVISGETSGDSGLDALKRGATDYLRKPYAPEQLVRSIENAARKQQLERENAEVESRLIESEKLHRYIVESSPDLIYMLDKDGRFSFVNSRIETLLGYRKSELIGMHYSAIVYDADQEYSRFLFNDRRTGDRAAHNIELRLKCRDGAGRLAHQRYLPVEINAMGMYRPGDAPAPERFRGTYGIARDISERKRAEELINFQASHDLLTRLPNRFLFKDRLALAVSQARRTPQTFAIMFLDLDRFKMVNDTLGHLIGDQLLQTVSKRILGCLREGDTLARAGGDEYMLLLPQAGRRSDAAEVARKILAALRQPFIVGDNELFVTVSIGLALYPEHGENPDTLIRRADIAMYEAKGRGKDAYEFYRDDMSAVITDYVSLESGMRRALESNQFDVYYQPQVDVSTGRVTAMEALVRWRHPTRGLLAPGEFIPIAEESGLIVPLGEWVLRRACADMAEWRREKLPEVRVAVNFSTLQFEQEGLVQTIVSVLDEFGLPGTALEVEITENLIMKDMEKTVPRLRELSAHGIRIAVDDFGTGYASLSYLRRLPIDTLKLDNSFVNDIHAGGSGTSITSAIASMADSLDLNLIAEGVETEQQMNYLRSIGCNEMQGFMLSPPLSAEAAKRFVMRDPESLAGLR
ncbi:MAG TPA: EAL domain-containing protein [Gammaproteobacteria bacterium]|nr:EAL domain-containing protein [Gammaproteobacteria bacterium]